MNDRELDSEYEVMRNILAREDTQVLATDTELKITGPVALLEEKERRAIRNMLRKYRRRSGE